MDKEQAFGGTMYRVQAVGGRRYKEQLGSWEQRGYPTNEGIIQPLPPRPIHVFILKSFVPRVFCKIVHRYVRPPPRYFSPSVIMLSMNDAVNCQIC